MRWLTSIVLMLLVLQLDAQTGTDAQLAAHYYREGDYIKAAMYYERLYNQQKTDFYYNYYLRCLLHNKDWEPARRLVKTYLKSQPFSFTAKVDFGKIYFLEGKPREGERYFEKTIADLRPSYADIKALADAFLQAKYAEYALKSYQQGGKLLKNTYQFNIELAEVYAELNRPIEMVDVLIDLLVQNEGYLHNIQTTLGKYSSLESGTLANEALKTRLIKESNRFPDRSLFTEMLIWLFLQEHNYGMAARQALALDKRTKSEGERLYGVAGIAYNNGYFRHTIEACDGVLVNFQESGLRDEAGVLKLTAGFDLLRTTSDVSENEVRHLQFAYREMLPKIKETSSRAQLLGRLAWMQGYYLHLADTALDTYEEALALPGLDSRTAAAIKLDYGDLLLASGFIWDAVMVYGQVEKDFKYDPLGDDAKYRGARISFYTGNFDLAAAHLNILKGSTSKYIANDALYLSVLISDNTGADSNTAPLLSFASADLKILQKKYTESIQILDSLNDNHPGHSLEDDILMLRYRISAERFENKAAATFLEQIIERFSYDILADKALFLLAELNETKLENKIHASELYEQLLTDYKDSVYTPEARKRLRKLQGKTEDPQL